MSESHTQNPITLVTGATGKTGRRIVEQLSALGWPVRRGSRSAERRFDWEDASTWSAALDGVGQVYIAFQPDLAVPHAVGIIDAFCKLAVELGVRKLVLLSGRGEDAAQACEQIVMNAGVDATVVRASWFSQNFSEGHFLDPLTAGVLALPVGEVGEPFVDVDDIADVAVAALTEERHAGKLYEVTGPRLLTFAEAVQAIGNASGRDIDYVTVSGEAYHAAMVEADVPEPLAAFFVELMSTVLDGRNAQVADGIQQALGRAPRDFTDFARNAAEAGVWSRA